MPACGPIQALELNPSDILGWSAPMLRWFFIAFLVSLGALLFAAAGVARHIYLQRKKLRQGPPMPAAAAQETDLEVEP